MLQYSAQEGRSKSGPILEAFQILSNSGDYEAATEELLPIVEQLFLDAEVTSDRVSSRGHRYSIAESGIREFFSWSDMPWE